MRVSWLLLGFAGCVTGPVGDKGGAETGETGLDTGVSLVGPLGFIGSPCLGDADCEFEGGSCLTEADGWPGGTCTAACDRFCPDADGFPTTFCVDESGWPGPALAGDGSCLARCDFGIFPESGCREGYGCADAPRANEVGTRQQVCLPGAETSLSACQQALVARGIGFSPTVLADELPAGGGESCHVEDPVRLNSPVLGVKLAYYDGSPTSSVLGACMLAHAIADTAEDLKAQGVTEMLHIGTYNCRTIAGSSSLSRHAFGDAIDIYGVRFGDGTTYTLVDDWEHDTEAPVSAGARFLFDAAHRWHDAKLWNIILTPNYNEAHDNHFHVDLTPGQDFMRASRPSVLAVAPLPRWTGGQPGRGLMVPTCTQ